RAKYAPANGLRLGGYVLADARGETPAIILLASGSEVELVLGAYERLTAEGIAARVVSLPSMELFARQPPEYRDVVLPPAVPARVAWHPPRPVERAGPERIPLDTQTSGELGVRDRGWIAVHRSHERAQQGVAFRRSLRVLPPRVRASPQRGPRIQRHNEARPLDRLRHLVLTVGERHGDARRVEHGIERASRRHAEAGEQARGHPGRNREDESLCFE